MNPKTEEVKASHLFDREVQPDQLLQWTALTATPKPLRPKGLVGALLVRAGEEWLALPSTILVEAMPMRPVHAVPYLSGPVFLGLVNAGGELLPCVSLAGLLSSPQAQTPAAKPRILSLSLAEGQFALLVDEIAGSSLYDPTTVILAPDTVSKGLRPLARGQVHLEKRLAGLLDQAALGQALLRSLRP